MLQSTNRTSPCLDRTAATASAADTTAFDKSKVTYMDCAREKAKAKSHWPSAQYLTLLRTSTQGCLNASWRLHAAWSPDELPTGCSPKTQTMAYARSGYDHKKIQEEKILPRKTQVNPTNTDQGNL